MSYQFHRRCENYLQPKRLSVSLGMLLMESVVSKVYCSVSTLSRTMPNARNIVLTPTVLKQGLKGLRQNLRRLYGASHLVIHFTVMCKSRVIIQTSNTRRCMSVAPTCVQDYSSLLFHPSTIKVWTFLIQKYRLVCWILLDFSQLQYAVTTVLLYRTFVSD